MICKYFLLNILFLISLNGIAQKINWSVWSQLPIADGQQFQAGLAGASSGINNDVMLIAGGANFENGFPWKGAPKKYFNDIYIIRKEGECFTWINKTFKLPFNLAYSATVSTSKGMVCIGGENENGVSPKVISLEWNNRKTIVEYHFLPDLPIGVTNASAVVFENNIIVLGGETQTEALKLVYKLDLNSGAPKWQKLTDLPIPLSHSVVVIQAKKLYLFGGRAKTKSGVSQLSNKAFQFDFENHEWKNLKNISEKSKDVLALSAGVGVAYENDKILLIGGDKGNIFSQIETYNAKIADSKEKGEKSRLQIEKVALLENHEGFSRDIYCFDINKNSWAKFGEMPMLTPLTTSLVNWNNYIFINSGEIKPGIRTPNIIIGKIKK